MLFDLWLNKRAKQLPAEGQDFEKELGLADLFVLGEFIEWFNPFEIRLMGSSQGKGLNPEFDLQLLESELFELWEMAAESNRLDSSQNPTVVLGPAEYSGSNSNWIRPKGLSLVVFDGTHLAADLAAYAKEIFGANPRSLLLVSLPSDSKRFLQTSMGIQIFLDQFEGKYEWHRLGTANFALQSTTMTLLYPLALKKNVESFSKDLNKFNLMEELDPLTLRQQLRVSNARIVQLKKKMLTLVGALHNRNSTQS